MDTNPDWLVKVVAAKNENVLKSFQELGFAKKFLPLPGKAKNFLANFSNFLALFSTVLDRQDPKKEAKSMLKTS